MPSVPGSVINPAIWKRHQFKVEGQLPFFDDPRMVLGLATKQIDWLEVQWPAEWEDGAVTDLPVDRTLTIVRVRRWK